MLIMGDAVVGHIIKSNQVPIIALLKGENDTMMLFEPTIVPSLCGVEAFIAAV
jgi:hypothetical protein